MDVVTFAREVLGLELTPAQNLALKFAGVTRGMARRAAFISGRRCGRSWLAAQALIEYLEVLPKTEARPAAPRFSALGSFGIGS